MSEFDIPEDHLPTHEYMALAADALRAQGANIIGAPIVEGYLDDEVAPQLRIRFMDNNNGIVHTAIPVPQEGTNEL